MAFNIPKPWSPGYAIPSYVKAEGLQRRAFVTEWSPRGTFDNPAVGDGGYAVPQYILDEDYGRGAYTTEMAPRGTYFGPRIPHWLNASGGGPIARTTQSSSMRNGVAVTLAPTPSSAPPSSGAQAHGQAVAAQVMAQVRAVPQGRRRQVLQQALSRIHPTLYQRAGAAARSLEQRGLHPIAALQHGIASAVAVTVARARGRRTPAAASSLSGNYEEDDSGLGGTPSSGSASSDAFATYGERSAAAIIGTVSRFPPSSRRAAIRRALDSIDPALWGQASQLATGFEKGGMTSDVALQTGIARAMSSTLHAEVQEAKRTGKVGRKGHLASARRVNQARQLGVPALGATTKPVVSPGGFFGSGHSSGNTVTAGKMIAVGPFMFPADQDIVVLNFTNPGEGQLVNKINSGAIYNASTGVMTPGHDVTFRQVSPAPGGIDFNASGSYTKLPPAMNITMGTDAANYFLSPDAQKAIVSILSKDCSFNFGALAAGALVSLINLPAGVEGFAASKPCVTSSMVDATEGHRYGALGNFIANLPSKINQDYIYMEGNRFTSGPLATYVAPVIGGSIRGHAHNGGAPIVATLNPVNNKDYGIFLTLGAFNNSDATPWGADPDPTKNNPVHMTMIWAPMEVMISKNWLQTLVAWVMHLAAEIIDAIEAIATFVAVETCQVLSTQATAAGAVAKAVCSPPPPPYLPPPPSDIPILLAAGAGLVALLVLKSKKHPAGTAPPRATTRRLTRRTRSSR